MGNSPFAGHEWIEFENPDMRPLCEREVVLGGEWPITKWDILFLQTAMNTPSQRREGHRTQAKVVSRRVVR